MLPFALAPGANFPIAFDDAALDTPALLVDLDIVAANIARMAGFAAREGFALRPHIKTHKSVAMAKRQLAAGAVGVCCATVSEAEVMAHGGVSDILIAYPLIGARKFARLRPLFDLATITLAADSAAIIEAYGAFAAALGRPVPVLLEIDTGMHRVGAAPEHAVALARLVTRQSNLRLRGIMTHAGQTHDHTSPAAIAAVARAEARIMGDVRMDLEAAGFEVPVVSAGSSITAAYLRRGDGITEIRPGTYIYNDLRTLSLFACTPEALAVTALATIVSLGDDRLTLHAGSKTLTTTRDPAFGHGSLLEAPAAQFIRLSEEHAVLRLEGAAQSFRIGQRVRLSPVHVCVWMDLQQEVYGTQAGRIVERITVEAMRHSL
jgi:D-serine deaminase-like pyridoxal phosphate-dependent protein